MDGGDADLAVPDRREVGALLVVMARRVVVDVVAHAPLLVADLDKLVLVKAAAEPRDPCALEPAPRHVGRVDVEDAALREPLEGDLGEPGGELRRRSEVQLRFKRRVLLDGLVPRTVYAQRDCDAWHPDDDPLHGPGDRP